MAAKIAIIGAGQVGAAAAYALLRDRLYGELILVDVKVDLREGQVRDLSDAACCEESSTRIRAGTYKDAGQCDIVVITAGSRRKIGKWKTTPFQKLLKLPPPLLGGPHADTKSFLSRDSQAKPKSI